MVTTGEAVLGGSGVATVEEKEEEEEEGDLGQPVGLGGFPWAAG